ncbi:AraC family transcriptional regulator [Hoyosella sp. YIM 151337]|uniref:AraC family transcriptional regulator n=1 Tax=Hoyosella sp. YIM 151337 TaxID=2992742 RepID=UPI002236B2D2|nr:AraC family transcriptional regulator [Hoyosella sp. YIM 151337]MCW4352650.1 AraC family transcriptional regulator [Hoyosella sp. YIM 151337]
MDVTGIADWRKASQAVAAAYFPHELKNLTGAERPSLHLRTADLGGVTIGKLSWGTDVAIACDYEGAYEVNIPLTGLLETRGDHPNERVASVPGQAAVFQADTPSLITRWSSDCAVLGVKFEREYLEREADRITQSTVRSRLSLPQQLDLSGRASEWHRLVRALAEQVSPSSELISSPLVSAQLSGAVTAAFVLAIAPPDERSTPPHPGMVRRVLTALNDDPARPWTAADMAEIAGTSVRRMQETFAQYVGSTPLTCLMDVRLDRAHRELLSGGVTVTEVAARWGFSHPSRFSAAYRRRYGQTPSATLRS